MTAAAVPVDLASPNTSQPRPLRVRVPVTLVALFWAFVAGSYLLDLQTFNRFLAQLGCALLVSLSLIGWWVFNGRVPWRYRIIVPLAAIVGLIVGTMLAHPSLQIFPAIYGLPLTITAATLWLVLGRGLTPTARLRGLVAVLFLPAILFPLLRASGLTGAGTPEFAWRWQRSAEERYLSSRGSIPATAPATATTQAALTLRSGDWPGFRGANRDGIVRDAVPAFATDWEQHPPKQLWRQPIGPGWSSMTIVSGRLFTQEQRGEEELVVCLSADTGSEIWSHTEHERFWDVLSSAGPRATPTFDNGRLYVQGATGTLLCLDAATGNKIWSRNVLTDSGGKLPEWGVSASPLITDGVVITFCSGEGNKGLLAYRADTGELAWSADEGLRSYTSPQLATIGGKKQVLFLGDQGLCSRDAATGELLWRYAMPGREPRSCQPMLLDDARILVSLGMDAPTDLIEVKPDNTGHPTATKRWTSRNLKPSFNDFVIQDNHAYGFDGRIFTCVNLETGERQWKQGRYGTGQAILLADKKHLIVLTDDGQAALVSANPNSFEELGRFQALSGKTWNHPVVSHGRLYVRNAEEMACYELSPAQK